MKNNPNKPKIFNKLTISRLWALNILALIGLAGFFFLQGAGAQSAPEPAPVLQASSTPYPTPTFTVTPAITTSPTAAKTPVVATASPAANETPAATATPAPEVIGYSVEGRPIEVYTFGEGPIERLIVAGIHGGNEHNTIELAYEIIKRFQEKPYELPKGVKVYIVPNLNPDGYARTLGLEGRVNANGVDLNRNWPYNWKSEGWSGNCWRYLPVTSGDHPASEPETATIIAFLDAHPKVDGLISFHAAALGIFAGGLPEYAPSVRLAERLGKIGKYYYPPKDIKCEYSGNMTDWASNTRKIAAVDVELYDHKYTYFEDNFLLVKEFLKFRK